MIDLLGAEQNVSGYVFIGLSGCGMVREAESRLGASTCDSTRAGEEVERDEIQDSM
jgi:hypothetical protein